jgi:hypothetical protein
VAGDKKADGVHCLLGATTDRFGEGTSWVSGVTIRRRRSPRQICQNCWCLWVFNLSALCHSPQQCVTLPILAIRRARWAEAHREKQDLKILYLTRIGIETRDNLVAQLLRFLLWIRRAFVDMQNVCVAIVLEAQLRARSASPSASFRVM